MRFRSGPAYNWLQPEISIVAEQSGLLLEPVFDESFAKEEGARKIDIECTLPMFGFDLVRKCARSSDAGT